MNENETGRPENESQKSGDAAFDPARRFVRQTTFAPLGAAGQQRLARGRALVVGMGALGSQAAEILARAGVGFLRIVDGDLLQPDNLHRQTLYVESDARDGLPKVQAAARHLKAINSSVVVDPLAVMADPRNVVQLMEGIDVVIDGTDRFATRFLLNAAAVRAGVPLVHGGCLGCDGQVMVVLPGETACLQCLMPDGVQEEAATCETAGVLMPVVTVVAGLQALEAMKILSGNRQAVSRDLTVFSLWDNRIRQVGLGALAGNPERGCSVCNTAGRQRIGREETEPFVTGPVVKSAGDELQATRLCGREAVQVVAGNWRGATLQEVAGGMAGDRQVGLSPFMLRVRESGLELSLFADGRAIVDGTGDEQVACGVYLRCFGRWLGSGSVAPL